MMWDPIFLHAYYSQRATVRTLLERHGLTVRPAHFYNRSLFRKGLIVRVDRGQGGQARQILIDSGYRIKR